MVKEECLRKTGAPGELELRLWFETIEGIAEIVQSPIMPLYQQARAQEIEGSDPYASEGLGDAAISWLIAKLPRLHGQAAISLVFTEDATFGNMRLGRNVHVLSTRPFLATLQNLGLIPSAESILRDIASAGRTVAPYQADRPALLGPKGKLKTQWTEAEKKPGARGQDQSGSSRVFEFPEVGKPSVLHERLGMTAHRRALLLINRASRRGALGIGTAAARLAAGGVELREVDSEGDPSAVILAHRGEVDCVILAGGDGTVNAAGRGLVETGLPLGVLPLGTANDFARSIGVPMDLDVAARVIVDGFTHRVDVGEVNGHPFFNVASVGLAADLAKKLTREGKRRFGRLSYAMTAARLLLQARPFHATLLVGEDKVMVRTMQIAVGNGRYYGGGNVVVADARIDDGRLDLYSLEFSQVWRMALLLPHFKRGAHGAVREVRTASGVSFEVITRRPRSINADGELVTKTPAVFTQKPGAVTVYVPETCPLVTVPA